MNKTEVVFFDMTCPKPYNDIDLATEAMGGTEASVIRIAEKLAQDENYQVTVIQHCRQMPYASDNGVLYAPITEVERPGWRPQNIVCLRVAQPLAFLNKMFPDAKLFLWLHDLEGAPSALAQNVELLNDTKPTLVTVSKFHMIHVTQALQAVTDVPKFSIKYIYNPIEDDLKPDDTPVDKNKMVFLSSPHKGLDHVLKMFKLVAAHYPNITLYVANPGYVKLDPMLSGANVVRLGELAPADYRRHMREAFCVFYPNPDYFTRETYGIVAAEANAVGTPIMAASAGALPEVATNTEQYVKPRDPQDIIMRLEKWRKWGRPKVSLDIPTRTSEVVEVWKSCFNKA